MLVKCKDILPIITKRGGILLAGEKGLDRLVSWCYIVTYEELEECLRGGEFVFIPEVSGERDNLLVLRKLIESANKMKASGVCIMVGSDSIPEIPREFHDMANEMRLPLFEISWDDWLVDWTYEIGNMIFTLKNSDMEQRAVMLDILYNQIYNLQTFHERLTLINHDFSIPHAVMVMDIEYPVSAKINLKYIIDTISEYVRSCFKEAIFLVQGSRVVYFITTYEEEKKLSEKCREIIERSIEKFKGFHFLIGIGARTYEIEKYHESYIQALKMLDILINNSLKNQVADYFDLGIQYLILQQNDKEYMMECCRKEIGLLIEEDNVRKTELIKTFYEYFITQYNLSKTAKNLYVHRNTVLHRLEQIEHILHKDLSDPLVCLNLINYIMLYRFLY